MKKKGLLLLVALAVSAALVLAGCESSDKAEAVKLDPNNPVTITVWHYYHQDLQEAFDSLVEEFNETVGRQQGIFVESSSQGTVGDLEKSVLDAANKTVGAGDVPNIFAAYPDTVYEVDQLGLVVDISKYFSKSEMDLYIDSYMQEGRFSEDDVLKIFPIAKAVEVMLVNKTDWDAFATATGATYDDINTIEGLSETARKYYEWTDSLTPDIANDGRALFGRDALANYFNIGAKQLGHELITRSGDGIDFTFDQAVIRKLWDNYYLPFVKGHFAATGRFRSADVKMGHLISFVGSSASATFFPKEVILNDTDKYPIEMVALPAPQFEGSNNYAVQQGAGMVVTTASEEQVYASVVFLKWFTQVDRNIEFSLKSGYLPVTKEANDIERIRPYVDNDTEVIKVLEAAIDTVNNNSLYMPPAFENSTEFRSILDSSLADKAAADREALLDMLANGTSYDDAVAVFANDDNFTAWYEYIKAQLEALVY